MEEINYYCDICKKKVAYNYVIVKIFIGDSREWKEGGAYNYQNNYNILVCDNCIGSDISRCNGSHGGLEIVDRGINLLKNLKIIK